MGFKGELTCAIEKVNFKAVPKKEIRLAER